MGINSDDIPPPVQEKVEHWLAKGIYGRSGRRFDFALAAAAKRAGLALPPIPITELNEKGLIFMKRMSKFYQSPYPISSHVPQTKPLIAVCRSMKTFKSERAARGH